MGSLDRTDLALVPGPYFGGRIWKVAGSWSLGPFSTEHHHHQPNLSSCLNGGSNVALLHRPPRPDTSLAASRCLNVNSSSPLTLTLLSPAPAPIDLSGTMPGCGGDRLHIFEAFRLKQRYHCARSDLLSGRRSDSAGWIDGGRPSTIDKNDRKGFAGEDRTA